MITILITCRLSRNSSYRQRLPITAHKKAGIIRLCILSGIGDCAIIPRRQNTPIMDLRLRAFLLGYSRAMTLSNPPPGLTSVRYVFHKGQDVSQVRPDSWIYQRIGIYSALSHPH